MLSIERSNPFSCTLSSISTAGVEISLPRVAALALSSRDGMRAEFTFATLTIARSASFSFASSSSVGFSFEARCITNERLLRRISASFSSIILSATILERVLGKLIFPFSSSTFSWYSINLSTSSGIFDNSKSTASNTLSTFLLTSSIS